MPYDDIYEQVIEDFPHTGSVKKTAENVGTTLVRCQRILITEGLWSSPTSEKVGELYRQGKTVAKIAKELQVSEKTVQAYLPYTRSEKGYGGQQRSADARKSEDYRVRMRQAAKTQVSLEKMESEPALQNVGADVRDGTSSGRSLSKHAADGGPDSGMTGMNKEQSRQMNMTTEALYGAHMKEAPQVLKLRLELNLQGIDEETMGTLRKYGKVRQGITREILVPADITLHALHYAIQKCFGWQNSHLHSFWLPGEVFQKMTKGKSKTDETGFTLHDGKLKNWVKFCGVYFRCPSEFFEDIYWDNDYRETMNFKSWLRRKYTGPYSYNGEIEHYRSAQEGIAKLLKKLDVQEPTIRQLEMEFFVRVDELLERLPVIELMIPRGISEDPGIADRLFLLAGQQRNRGEELPVLPVSQELIYGYDFRDGWEVQLQLLDCYYTGSERGVYDMDNQPVSDDLAQAIGKVIEKHRPRCVSLDGMQLMDDVGGICGYAEFLERVHGEDPEKREEARNWAKNLGWIGRMCRPENLL